jgi:GAF domain-containing protein/PAS domain-containing protein
MDWRLIPYSLPLLLTAALSATIALYSWRRRHNPAIVPFALLMAAIAVWLLGYGLLLLCIDLSLRLFWSNVRDLGVVATPTLWLVFTLQYTGRCRLLHRRFLALLAVEPTLTWLILWTNHWHHLFYHSVVWDWTGPIPALRVTQYGVWFWINVFYSYALLLISTLLLLGLYHNVARPHRQRTMILLIYTFVPWLGSLLYILGVRLYYLDPTPFSFMLAGLVIGWGLLRYRLLDIAPIAYASVIAGLRDGVILLDTRNWVVDLNPAASRLLDITPAQAVERPLAQVWPAGWSLLANRDAGEEMRASVTLQVGAQPTVCDLHVSPLRDVSNCLVLGRLLVLHDVTERQQAQEALQRARVELEKRVQERTAELLAANEALRREVEIRKRAEAAERSQRALAEALRDATSALTSPLGQDEVLDRILAGIGQVIQHEAGTIALIEGDTARVVRARGYRERRLEELVLQVRLPIARLPHLRRMVETGQPVVIPDTRGDPDWLSLPATDWIASFLGAPIRVGDQVIGFLNLDSAIPGFFSPSQIEVLQAFADQAGIALERARLFAHLRDANEQLQRAVQARDEMIQNVSHELRTPLTPIHGYIEMLESGALGALTEDQKTGVARHAGAGSAAALHGGPAIDVADVSSGSVAVHVARCGDVDRSPVAGVAPAPDGGRDRAACVRGRRPASRVCRSYLPGAGDGQSARQRCEIQPWGWRCLDHGLPEWLRGAAGCRRSRHRHRGGGSQASVRAFLSGGRRVGAALRRIGDRPRPVQADRRGAWGAHLG